MRRAWLRLLFAMASLLALQACASLSGQIVKVDEADSARPIELKPGQLLEIRLTALAARGLTISLGSVVTPTLVLDGTPTYNDDPVRGGVSGAIGYEAWRFRAVQAGETEVRMDYRLQWESTGAPTRSVTYKVVVR